MCRARQKDQNFTVPDFVPPPCGAKCPPADPGKPSAWYPPVIQDPNADPLATDGNHPLFTATDVPYRSYDRGKTWVSLCSGCTLGGGTTVYPDIDSTNVITAMAVARADSNRMYIGYYDGQVWSSGDARSSSPTWSRVFVPGVESGLGVVTGIAVHPERADEVYFTLSNAAGTAVMGSTSAGATWTNITGSLDATPINTIAVEPGPPNRLLLGRDDGAYFRASGLAGKDDWTSLGIGLPSVPVYALAHDGVNLYAATHGRGVFFLGSPVIRDWVDTCPSCVPDSPIIPMPSPPPPTHAGYLDLPIFAYGLPRGVSCTMRLFNSSSSELGGKAPKPCANGHTDGLLRRIRTNDRGQLVTEDGAGNTLDHVWACYDGRCAGDSGFSACLSAPINDIELRCGSASAHLSVVAPTNVSAPPPTVMTVSVPSGFASQGTLVVDVMLRDAIGNERLLCSTTIGLVSGMSSETALELLRDGINADPVCIAQGVQANASPPEIKEDAARSRRLEVKTTQSGTQIVTRIRAHVDSVGYGFEGLSDGMLGHLTTPTLTVVVPSNTNGQVTGASGGTIAVTAWTFEGSMPQGLPRERGRFCAGDRLAHSGGLGSTWE